MSESLHEKQALKMQQGMDDNMHAKNQEIQSSFSFRPLPLSRSAQVKHECSLFMVTMLFKQNSKPSTSYTHCTYHPLLSSTQPPF